MMMRPASWSAPSRASGFRRKSFRARYGTKQEMSPEIKFYDVAYNQGTGTNSTLLMFVPLEGSDFNQRVGRKVSVTSVHIKGFIAYLAASLSGSTGLNTAGSDCVHLAVVYDKQTNGAAVQYTDIYTNSGANGPFEFRNVNNLDRFIVLKEWLLKFDTAADLSQTFEAFIKIKHDVRFNGVNGGTVADITTGGFFLTWCTTNTTGNLPGNLLAESRVAYKDD